MKDRNDPAKTSLGGGTVSPTAQAEIMPTGIVHPNTAALGEWVSRKPEDDPLKLFRRCFEVPLHALRSLANGDGGFAALIIACPLYERYVKFVRGRATDQAVADQLVEDFNLTRGDAQDIGDVVVMAFSILRWSSHARDRSSAPG